jgi:hypothetical protein
MKKQQKEINNVSESDSEIEPLVKPKQRHRLDNKNDREAMMTLTLIKNL